jgi:hypothetical protein
MKGGTTREGGVYWKRAGAGFGLPRMRVRVEDGGMPCNICGDMRCIEYANAYEVDAAGRETGRAAYHVSECDLEPVGGV